MDADKLEELERLLAGATKGPWIAAAQYVHANTRELARCYASPDLDRTPPEANAALIVAAINALPELVAKVRELNAARAELAAERAKMAVFDEALTMACDERDAAYDHIDKIKEAAGPFTWYLSSSVFDALPDDHVPRTDDDVGRRVIRLGDLRRLAAALREKP
jgi:cell division protein ZapA (FtsZ GTPase activity inhibitor)